MNISFIQEFVRKALFVTACISSILVIPRVAHSYCQMTTDSNLPGECPKTGVPLFWDCGEIEYGVCPRKQDDPPFSEVVDAIDESFQTWENAECDGQPIGFKFNRINTPIECGQHRRLIIDPETDFSPKENLILFVEDWYDFGYDPGAFALTSVWHNTATGEIVGVDMELNETIGRYGVCDESVFRCRNTIDIRNVVTHEIGHILGLGHTTDRQAVMYAESQIGDLKKRELKADDIAGLCSIYSDASLSSCFPYEGSRSLCTIRGMHAANQAPPYWILTICFFWLLTLYKSRF